MAPPVSIPQNDVSVSAQFSIGIIGAGNVASNLVPALKKAGHDILFVHSRRPATAAKLAHRVDAEIVRTLDQVNRAPDMLLIMVPDDAIERIVSDLPLVFSTSILVHTSGGVAIDIFDGHTAGFGVFYPLQTFSRDRKLSLQSVPICLHASDDQTRIKLEEMALSISERAYRLPDEDRAVLHLAAVFANNFTNHLLHLASDILKTRDLPYDLLQPLIAETVRKARRHPPQDAQTGPAARRDVQVIEKHLRLLKDEPAKRAVYELLTQSIQNSQV